ncbi:MAG: PD40 domain-containing protein [Candidatus Marinimicrobia bacterium]|nr:PD40 domain-containing protein [Candidatus Neomarinimicrobiota bacterium]
MNKIRSTLLVGLLLPGIVFSQFYFGRNKIQYDDFEWQVYESEHFNLYFYAGEELLAQAAINFAEQAFTEFEQQFNYTLNRRVPLVIYSNHIHFQQTNILSSRIPEGVGGFFEFIKKRVVIPYNGNMYDFRHVIRHELVHVFTHAKIARTNSNIGSWEMPQFPLWFIEGLAELWSTHWDSQAEMVIRDALLYDHLFPLNSEALYRAGYLLYKEGQSFLDYIQTTYGADCIRRIMEDYWQYESIEATFAALTNLSWETLNMDWKLALKKNQAEALIHESVLPNGSAKLTSEGTNVSPVVYTDHLGQRHLIYMSNRSGYTDILSKETGSNTRDETIIRGGRTAEKETLHILQSGLNISSKGVLAYVAKSGRQDVIHLVALNNSEDLNSFRQENIISIRSPSWSGDGNRLVFSTQGFNGISDLYLWDVNEKLLIKLTDDIYSDSDPHFDVSDKKIIFSSDRGRNVLDGSTDLFILNLADNSLLQVTDDKYHNYHPLPSLIDSAKYYFISNRTGTPNIWSFTASNIDSSKKLQIEQVSNFHTGVHDIAFYGRDTLISSSFREYGFQIHQLPLNEFDSGVIDTVTMMDVVGESWQIPDIAIPLSKKKKPYRLDYSLDLAQTAVAYDPIYGLLGGAQLSISDLLGNRYYHFLLTNTAQSSGDFLSRFNFAVTMVDLKKRSNLALGIFHFANDYFDPYQAFYFERTYGLRVGINYPIDVFRRIEFSSSLWYSEKDFYYDDLQTAYLISNFISFVHDNSLWYYTGPIDGWSFRTTIGPTFDLDKNQLHNFTGLIDFRYYYRFYKQLTFAHRSMLWVNDGTDIRRYYIGGSWGIRGYRLTEIYGRKFMMFNQELRFPFANSLALNFKRISIGVAPIRGALFFDVGNAWDYNRPDLIGSMGFGIRGMFLGGIVLRLDMGRKTDFHSIDDNWFMQFFFGWDY